MNYARRIFFCKLQVLNWRCHLFYLSGSVFAFVIIATATHFSSSECDIEIGHDENSVTLFESEDPKALTQFLEKHSLSTLASSETT